MKKLIFFLFVLVSINGYSQSYSVIPDNYEDLKKQYMEMYNDYKDLIYIAKELQTTIDDMSCDRLTYKTTIDNLIANNKLLINQIDVSNKLVNDYSSQLSKVTEELDKKAKAVIFKHWLVTHLGFSVIDLTKIASGNVSLESLSFNLGFGYDLELFERIRFGASINYPLGISTSVGFRIK